MAVAGGPVGSGHCEGFARNWRRATASRGVSLYIHFSGVWDFEACKRHPEWARVGPDGARDKQQTSTFGSYVDLLMLRQLREAATKYDLDGAWVDGECWAINPDYYPGVEAAFRDATGFERLPKHPKDPGWLQFLEFNRRQFRHYVRHYVDELHRTHPRFQVASNWLYSTFVPEEPELPVDFLSGDFIGNASVSAARLEARYLAQTGKTWDLMAWGFQDAGTTRIGAAHKPAVQLQQEERSCWRRAGIPGHYNPSRAGWFEPAHVEVMRRVGDFCRERQAVSHQWQTVPQIGVLFSRESLYATSGKLFGWWGKLVDPVRGWLDALTALHYSADVVPDWKLARIVHEYPLMVLPEWAVIGEGVKKTLLEYTAGGGRLVICGAYNAAVFAASAGIRLAGDQPTEQAAWIGGSEVLANLRGPWREMLMLGMRPCWSSASRITTPWSGGKAAAVARRVRSGRDRCGAGAAGLGLRRDARARGPRFRVRRLVGARFRPLVDVTAPPAVEVVLRREQWTAGSSFAEFDRHAGRWRVCGHRVHPPSRTGPSELPWKPERVELHPGGARLQPPHTQAPGPRPEQERVDRRAARPLHIHEDCHAGGADPRA